MSANSLRLLQTLVIAAGLVSHSEAAGSDVRFQFGTAKPARGYTQVLPSATYSKETGYGFDVLRPAGTALPLSHRGVCSDKPFFFSVDVPEGNYDVKLTLGDQTSASSNTIRAESRRLMIENADTKPGQFVTRTVTVNVRYSEISATESVRLKPREIGKLDWDHKLTLEFNGSHPCVAALEILPAKKAITLYLAGDSTVVDQDQEPWAAWGQMLPRFFRPGVAVSNQAESGEALRSFLGERRLAKILGTMKAGDYLFIQFAHNDEKPGGAYVEPFTTYKQLLKHYIEAARGKGATPVLVTPMHRRTFDDTGKITNSHGDYPEAMRQAAREEHVALIDLTAMSKLFYEALGPEGSKKAFVHYAAGTYPGQSRALADNTHFNSYGAYELAKCIVEGIRRNKLGLASFIVNGLPRFDPAHPDPVERWRLPPSPTSAVAAPEGR